jgi:hypothetical protein
MFKSLLAIVATTTLAISLTGTAQAASNEAELAPAKLVIYRADESLKTREIKFQAHANGENLARMSYKQPLVTDVAPGTVHLRTNMPGSEPLALEMKPGQTYYVHATLKKFGTDVFSSLELVEEQIALVHKPAMDGAI